ncbi:MAG: Glu/Leu/Phe/Val dehydrogenase [bacterium]|nr:Glu/Leu/Phe/Val dehydrogenase [bacterium]
MIVSDKFGPQYVIEVNSLKPCFKGFLIIDNLVLGVGKGGIRMAANLTLEELFRLARTMTWKNSLFGLPFGGAKAGIVIDPRRISLAEKKKIIQQFARLIAPFVPKYYIAGPDIGIGEREMRWFAEAIGNWTAATGKPADFCRILNGKKFCGLPHELGSTGFGVAMAAKTAAEFAGNILQSATAVIAGFGNVGSFVAKHLDEMGVKIIAISDYDGAIFDSRGLPVKKLLSLIKQGKRINDFPGVQKMPRDKIYELKTDILIPAAVSDVITDKNWRQVKARIIVEGANIPIPEDIEEKLWRKGILIVPDFVANGGGVISSFAEYKGGTPKEMFKIVSRKIEKATRSVLAESLKSKRNPRQVAFVLAKRGVK